MANKQLFKSFVGKLIPQTDTTNEAGGKAYKLSEKQALAQFAVTGTFNQTYYSKAEDQLSEVTSLVGKVDAEFIAKLALYSRRKAHMKDLPAYLLAVLSIKDGELLETVFDRVLTNSKMIRNFVQIMRSGATGRKSLGSRPKRLIKKWLKERSDKELLAASIGNDPSLADIIKMVHPKPESATRKAMYAYLIGKEYDAEKLPEIVHQYEAFKKGEGKIPDVPFQLLTSLNLTEDNWCSIAENAPWQMTRMNLNTFARHGVFKHKGLIAKVSRRLKDHQLIKKARVFPYQLMMAWKTTNVGVPQKINDALHEAMEIAVKNVPAFKGKVHVLVDVSGSMSCSVTGWNATGPSSKVRCVDAASLLAAAVLRNNPDAQIIPFDTKAVSLKLNRYDSVMTNAEKLANVCGGGTDCSAPLRALNKDRAESDLLIMISDNESWAGQTHSRGTNMMNEWRKFKFRNPQAKMVCIDIQPYANSQMKDDTDILNIGGFSDQVFEVIKTFHQEGFKSQAFIERIEREKL